ncbi:hypothetical protein V8C42DRAFT_199083 [Trichoderma barbatum]
MYDMSLPKTRGHEVRKSRQSELPVIKFRSSCDFCTEAKVRCDKKQLRCSRCVRLGRACRYSVSMRTGKPAIDLVKALNAGMLPMPHQQPQDQQQETTADGAASSDTDESIQAFLEAKQNPSPGNMAKFSMPSCFEPVAYSASYQDHDLGLNFEPISRPESSSAPSPAPPTAVTAAQDNDICMQSGQITPLSSLNSVDTATIMDYFHTSGDDFASLGIEPHSPIFSHSAPQQTVDLDYFCNLPTLRSNDSAITVDPALEQPGDRQYKHSCVRTAKLLQQSVIIMASGDDSVQREAQNISPNASPATTTDQALLMCLSVSKRLVEILQCQCEVDAYLPFLISVIISKVLAAYGAIAKVDDSTPFGFASGSTPNPQEETRHGQGQGYCQAAFTAVPLRLGAYDVDGELEDVLRVQLILHELSKFNQVIQLFQKKYCQLGEDDGGRLNDARIIYSALGQFITNRYDGIKAACELRSSAQTVKSA